ncbi:MAG TPA: hypothetical protein VFT19_08305 [Solirubrobacterales bacterium]|nr:hypothetical protein [Solirubrobacterales bacterium]
MREAWTDERLDDLNAKVDEGFRRQEVQVAEVRTDIRDVRGEVRDVRGEVRELRTEMNGRFDQMYRILVIASISLVVGFLGVIASILATGA